MRNMRCVSVSGAAYRAIREHTTARGVSVSAEIESWISTLPQASAPRAGDIRRWECTKCKRPEPHVCSRPGRWECCRCQRIKLVEVTP